MHVQEPIISSPQTNISVQTKDEKPKSNEALYKEFSSALDSVVAKLGKSPIQSQLKSNAAKTIMFQSGSETLSKITQQISVKTSSSNTLDSSKFNQKKDNNQDDSSAKVNSTDDDSIKNEAKPEKNQSKSIVSADSVSQISVVASSAAAVQNQKEEINVSKEVKLEQPHEDNSDTADQTNNLQLPVQENQTEKLQLAVSQSDDPSSKSKPETFDKTGIISSPETTSTNSSVPQPDVQTTKSSEATQVTTESDKSTKTNAEDSNSQDIAKSTSAKLEENPSQAQSASDHQDQPVTDHISEFIAQHAKADKTTQQVEDSLKIATKEQLLEKLIFNKIIDAQGGIVDGKGDLTQISKTDITSAKSLISQLEQSTLKTQISAEKSLQSAAQPLQSFQLVNSQAGKSAENSSKGEAKEVMKPIPKPLELRTMERVENVLKEVSKSKDGKTISLRLDPPELGTLKVDMSLRDGGIHARIVAESPQVTNLLKERTGELVQMIRKLGLNVDKVTVTVSQQNNDSQSNTTNHFDSSMNNQSSQNESSGQFSRDRDSKTNGWINNAQGGANVISANNKVEDHWIA